MVERSTPQKGGVRGEKTSRGARGGGGLIQKSENISESATICLHLAQNIPFRLTCPSHVPVCVRGDVGPGLLGVIEM